MKAFTILIALDLEAQTSGKKVNVFKDITWEVKRNNKTGHISFTRLSMFYKKTCCICYRPLEMRKYYVSMQRTNNTWPSPTTKTLLSSLLSVTQDEKEMGQCLHCYQQESRSARLVEPVPHLHQVPGHPELFILFYRIVISIMI